MVGSLSLLHSAAHISSSPRRLKGRLLFVLAVLHTTHALQFESIALRPARASLTHIPRTSSQLACSRLRRAAAPQAVANTQVDTQVLDVGALGRYVFAVLIQITLISTAFGFVDLYCYGPLPGGAQLGGPLPWQAIVGIFLALSLRSRLFNPLDNSRPAFGRASPEDDEELAALVDSGKARTSVLRAECEKRGLQVDNTMTTKELANRVREYLAEPSDSGTDASQSERLMPSWMPPGVVFPVMWLLVVAPMRAFAASLVYEASTGRLNAAHLNDPVLLWLVLHLAIGDTWNTINNTERRLGAAVPGVTLVWLSTIFAAKQFYDVQPLAGGLLALTAVWITVAGALVADTWRVNNAVVPESIYPWKRPGMRSQTRFWFEE